MNRMKVFQNIFSLTFWIISRTFLFLLKRIARSTTTPTTRTRTIVNSRKMPRLSRILADPSLSKPLLSAYSSLSVSFYAASSLEPFSAYYSHLRRSLRYLLSSSSSSHSSNSGSQKSSSSTFSSATPSYSLTHSVTKVVSKNSKSASFLIYAIMSWADGSILIFQF